MKQDTEKFTLCLHKAGYRKVYIMFTQSRIQESLHYVYTNQDTGKFTLCLHKSGYSKVYIMFTQSRIQESLHYVYTKQDTGKFTLCLHKSGYRKVYIMFTQSRIQESLHYVYTKQDTEKFTLYLHRAGYMKVYIMFTQSRIQESLHYVYTKQDTSHQLGSIYEIQNTGKQCNPVFPEIFIIFWLLYIASRLSNIYDVSRMKVPKKVFTLSLTIFAYDKQRFVHNSFKSLKINSLNIFEAPSFQHKILYVRSLL